jgi:hypothetical protein
MALISFERNNNMAETRGVFTIVDRVEGFGHQDSADSDREDNGVWGSPSGNEIDVTDNPFEDVDDRVERLLAERKSFKESSHPAIVDRGLTTSQFAANESNLKNGIFYDAVGEPASGTGNNVALTDSDSEALASGRTADSRDTVLLNDDDAASRAESARTSLRDRSSGWGHTDGSFTYRKD